MLSYIAAVATAATLFISPILSHASENVTDIKKGTIVALKTFMVNQPIVVNTPLPVYILSKNEQLILRSALFRSVKVLSPTLQS